MRSIVSGNVGVFHMSNVLVQSVPSAPPQRPLRWYRFISRRSDLLAHIPQAAFEQDSLELRAVWQRYFLLSNPDDVRHVLHDHADRYERLPTTKRLFRRVLGESLITTEGDTWRQHRHIMAPAFTPRRIRSYAPLVTQATAGLIAAWEGMPDGTEVDLIAAVRRLTVTIVCQAMFSTDAPEDITLVQESVPGYVRGMRPGIFDLLPYWPRLPSRRPRKMVPGLDTVIKHLLARRRSPNADADDLLRLLLGGVEDGSMSLENVADHVAHLLIAGHETTEQTLLWAWYLLSQHPAEQAKLHAELDQVLAGRSPGIDDLTTLPYTRMVIEETMRLYPPAHTLTRQALVDDELPGRLLPKGALVFIVPWVIHRHRRLWDQPERFDPERFTVDRVRARHPFAYIPFGGGPRTCLGSSLGMMEAVLILAGISQHYRLHFPAGQAIEPFGSVTLRPRYGMTAIPERRRADGSPKGGSSAMEQAVSRDSTLAGPCTSGLH
jgi:cytochrome P450